ncbi:MAG: putative toxin-antitoxin system toxin component, PIN family [Bryobacterales bacterium]|nr:putative toxin-antitoxin system toxin component, PIN family [Bryobacterales bacterium]
MVHRAVIDTNVLVAGLRSRRGTSFRLLQALGDPRWRPCLSVPVALEYEDVLKREFMQSVISATDVDSLLDYLFAAAGLVEVQFRLRPALRDPDDDRILELAARAGAVIVTFNTRDFAGAAAYGVQVVRPVEFLQQIGDLR